MIPPHRIFATTRVLRDAERLLPGRCLEVEVERAILAGRKRRNPKPGMSVRLADGERFVLIDENVAAAVAKRPSPMGRPSWMVTRLVHLRPQPRRKENTSCP